MILKSLILRIKRENKRPPIILDDQFAFVIESLITTIATEIILNYSTGVQRYRRLNGALASFLRDLFSIVSPNQISSLINAYFTAVHGQFNGHNTRNKTIETELRLQFIEEISLFDHILAANFPYTLDSPLSLFSSQISSRLYPLSTSQNQDLPLSSTENHFIINSPLPGESVFSGRAGEREKIRLQKAEKEVGFLHFFLFYLAIHIPHFSDTFTIIVTVSFPLSS
jgi:hypothetical protein